MNIALKKPPKNKSHLTSPEQLAKKLSVLIGQAFNLTGKSRTDGSNVRKLVGTTLFENNPPQNASKSDYEIIPPKSKGVPKILLEYIDTYIVTSGASYNLQVWNRNPSSESVQIQYLNSKRLMSSVLDFI
ncbi:MAG: hypothetical protein KZQ74_01610 [gamma proteobacterium symbiont of Bathyaustriella thionipta]|nr:hypothetical protein [gamma proteobacterium symbiont of Bathyaustriella thionipta]MCU7958367.1 hypothetical protein [gamma proteobacterium symbiont of Bathyaustriella thionipta]MCU7965901.1 hypothetical protein [gamma proteobacterium symbiont of Bathyaustriella thionipta]